MDKYSLRRSPLAITIGSILAGGSAHAATITVNTNADPGGPGQCSLRAAVESANMVTAVDGCASGTVLADEILFDQSLIGSTITLAAGEMEITGSLSITGPVPDDPAGITIDAVNLSRVFRVENTQVGMKGLTLTRGRTTGDTEPGGAVYAVDSLLLFEHIVLAGNHTTGLGSHGGAFAVTDSNTTLIHSRISGNSSASGPGGGGGGLSVTRGEAVLTNTTVSGNQASGPGGGVRVRGAEITLNRSTVAGNTASSYGGGFAITYFSATPQTTLIESTVSGNYSGQRGGGIFVNSGDMTLTNSTVSGNTASSSGGGLYLDANLRLTHSTVAFNQAGSGASAIQIGIDYLPFLGLYNSLVVQGDPGETACSHAADMVAGSLATGPGCGTNFASLADIKLAGLADNGGRTQTHALLPGSVAIDGAGDCDANLGVTTDQRGRPRPGTGSSACDIGAFELQEDDDVDSVFRDRFEAE